MANNSIKAAFERMWQHVVNALDGKAEVSHLQTIENGGTNATAAPEARVNLGFEYGETVPTHTPSTGDGSVYFMIEEDDEWVDSTEVINEQEEPKVKEIVFDENQLNKLTEKYGEEFSYLNGLSDE